MFKIIYRSLLLCCIFYLLILSFVLFKLNKRDRALPTGYLEKILSNQEVQVQIEGINANLDKKNKVINVLITNLTRTAKLNEQVLASLPHINLAIPLKSLLPFTKSHKKITIDNAQLNLNEVLARNIDQNNNLIRFLELEVAAHNVKLSIINNNNTTDWLLDSSFMMRNRKLNFSDFFLRNNTKTYLKLQGLVGEQIADVSIKISNLALNDIYKLWPQSLLVDVNTFLTSSLTDGYISNLDAKILYKKHKIHQTSNDITINGELKNITLKAHENLPIISKIDAKFNVEQNNINIEVLSAKISSSTISNTKIIIPFSLENIELKGQVYGKATDLLHFVPDKQLAGVKTYGVNFTNLEGMALTTIKKIIIPLKNNLIPEEITYDVASQLHELTWQIFPKILIQQHQKITLNFNGQLFLMQGAVKINDNNSNIKWAGYVPENSEHDFTLDINTHFSAQHPIKFEEYPIKAGKVVQDLHIFSKSGVTKASIKTDFTDAMIELKNLGFFKEQGVNLIFSANANTRAKLISVNNMLLAGKDVKIKGEALINQHDFSLKKLKLDHIEFNKNNFHLSYLKDNDASTTVITGQKIDLSHSNISTFFDKASNNNSKITLKLAEVLMKNNVIFSELDSYINCTKLFGCLNGSLTTKINEYFKLQGVLVPKIANIATLKITSDNASLISKAFNIYKDIDAGILEIKGTLHNQNSSALSKIEGSLNIKDFSVTKTSIFSRIISLTSLPGLMKLASSGKIHFNEMGFDFTANANDINISNGKMSGNEMDMTIEGEVNLAQKQLHLKGAVIPGVFFLNKILSSAPIIGKILKGSNKDGIISLNYKVGGSFDKPVIDANPFSITPGFIKSIFGILEKPASKMLSDDKKSGKNSEKKVSNSD
jgi:hypothetical protein